MSSPDLHVLFNSLSSQSVFIFVLFCGAWNSSNEACQKNKEEKLLHLHRSHVPEFLEGTHAKRFEPVPATRT